MGDPAKGPQVAIVINGTEVFVHRGSQTVSSLKEAVNVPAADELDMIVDGKLVPLEDDGRVTIKGGERFASQPRRGGSS